MCVRTMTMVSVLLFGLLTAGCASILTGSDQQVLLRTDPSGGTCYVFDKDNNRIASGPLQAPAQIQLDRSKDDIVIRCQKQGYRDEFQIVESEFHIVTFLNFFSPLFGLFIGLPIDAMTGAMWEYPKTVELPLLPDEE